MKLNSVYSEWTESTSPKVFYNICDMRQINDWEIKIWSKCNLEYALCLDLLKVYYERHGNNKWDKAFKTLHAMP